MTATGGSWRPQHPLIGRLLANRFQVASFIREGGMAQVFCGLQDQEPRHVAIKIVHPELAQDSEIVGRFLREAEVAARLVHPNIVKIVDVGEDGPLLYMAMELLFGEDLSAPIKQRGSFSEARAARIVIAVCEALAHAHDQRVIHRDIKPENIMLCRDPSAPEHEIVKVLDFGIAKILDAKDVQLAGESSTSVRSVLTRVGAFVGTPAYVSPEQGRAEVLDTRADLYSLGVVLYELVCGALPFTGQTSLQVVARHVQDAPPPPSSLCSIHPRLEALILRLLAKTPAQRPHTARHVAAELRELLPELSAAPIERWIGRASRPGNDTNPGSRAKLQAAPTLAADADWGNQTARLVPGQLQNPAWMDRAREAIGLPPVAEPQSAPQPVPDSTPRRARLDVRPDHPLIGRVLQERFRVASFVTEGGMAQIFCGTDLVTSKPVAIKLVHPDLAQDREIVKRFVREVQLAARLDHPNIVRTLAIGDDPGTLYMVMEFLFGENLSAPIKQRGSFSEMRAVQIVIDICEALQHAHQNGVIHRDIKPENVMLCRQPDAPQEEVVKVLDFGIAKVLDAAAPDALLMEDDPTGARSVLTRVGGCVGTPAYMSPEQGDRFGTIDARSDVYSVGVLLYELLCGREPFVGETALQILARHIHDAPQRPSELTPMHPGLEGLVLFALAKSPADRPQSARQLADELRRLQPELSSVPGVAGAPPAKRPMPAAVSQTLKQPMTLELAKALKQTLPLHSAPLLTGGPVRPSAPPMPSRPAPSPVLAIPAPRESKPAPDPRIDRLMRVVGVLAVLLGLAVLAILALAVIVIVKK